MLETEEERTQRGFKVNIAGTQTARCSRQIMIIVGLLIQLTLRSLKHCQMLKL
jgi:hypothetical protein